jgi:hypothetical protein
VCRKDETEPNFLEATDDDAEFRVKLWPLRLRSRQSSSRGNWTSIWRRPDRLSPLICTHDERIKDSDRSVCRRDGRHDARFVAGTHRGRGGCDFTDTASLGSRVGSNRAYPPLALLALLFSNGITTRRTADTKTTSWQRFGGSDTISYSPSHALYDRPGEGFRDGAGSGSSVSVSATQRNRHVLLPVPKTMVKWDSQESKHFPRVGGPRTSVEQVKKLQSAERTGL